MTLLAIDWASVGVKAAQFILSFSILVVLHELGHFLPAKWFGCRVEKFYLFFDPWFSLWKKKKGETEYGLGWIPFGGYVKISGMIDESMDTEQLKQPPQPWEFRSKPAWQRLIIMLGGVVVNVILAIIIFIGITWYYGEEQLPVKNIPYGLQTDATAKSIGMQDGDNVIAIDGKPIVYFGTLESDIIFKQAKNLQVQRGDSVLTLSIPEGFTKKLMANRRAGSMVSPRFPIVIDSVSKDAIFTVNRLQKGDAIIAFNGRRTPYYQDLTPLKEKYKDSIVQLTVFRGTDTLQVRALVSSKGSIGFFPKQPFTYMKTITTRYTLLQSIPIGFTHTWETLGRYVTGIKQLFTGEAAVKDSLGSVISIGNTFPGIWDWERFWTLTGIFSIVLAFMNVLPIPALDGGHALFTLYEMITGKKPSDKFMEYAQIGGFVLLMSLMAYALGLDVWRIFK
jgi:regulator of sigma E protease